MQPLVLVVGPPPAPSRSATTAQHHRPHVHRLEAPPSEASWVGFDNLVDLTLQIDVFCLVENVGLNKAKTIKDLTFDSIILQQYDDAVSQYSETAVKEAISAELASLYNKDLVDAIRSELTPQQLKKVIETKWVTNSRPGQQGSSLEACFVAKAFSQKISNRAVETLAATSSPTSLRTSQLTSIIRQ